MPKTNYSIVDFTVLQGKLENDYGVEPSGSWVTIPVYNATEPLVQHQQGSEAMELADSSLGPSQFYVTEPFYSLSATTYVYCTDATNPPPWASLLLPISGYQRYQIGSTAVSYTSMGASATLQAGGDMSPGTYQYAITIVNGPDHATPFVESPASMTGNPSATTTATNKSVKITLNAPAANTFYRIYRTTAGGSVYYFLTDLEPGVNQYTDTTNDVDLQRATVAPVVADAGSVYFVPLSKDFPSANLKAFMHGHSRRLSGARGSWTLDAESGRALPMRWDIQGVYNPAAEEANPSVAGINPGIPFIFRKVSSTFFAHGANGGQISPFRLKSISFTPGTPRDNRRDAHHITGVIEIGIHRKFDARLEIVFEVAKSLPSPERLLDLAEEYNQMRRFSLSISVPRKGGSPDTGPFFVLEFPNLQVMDAPVLQSQDGGILSWRASFRPRNLNGENWSIIRFKP